MDILETYYKLQIGSLTWKDVAERLMLRFRKHLHPRSLIAAALQDTMSYLGISIYEALDRAQQARTRHKMAWMQKSRTLEEEIHSFYGEDNSYLFSLPIHWMGHTWHFVPRLSPGRRILEYGCGTAEMTRWLLQRYPQYQYTVADLAVASTLDFVRYRFKGLPVTILEIGVGREGLPLREEYDFIACVEVLEHCLDPLMVVNHLHDHLVKEGILYITYPIDRSQFDIAHNSENLRSSALQRDEVINFLEKNCSVLKPLQRLAPGLHSIWGIGALGIYKKMVS